MGFWNLPNKFFAFAEVDKCSLMGWAILVYSMICLLLERAFLVVRVCAFLFWCPFVFQIWVRFFLRFSWILSSFFQLYKIFVCWISLLFMALPPVYQMGSIVAKEKDNTLLPEISPNSAPQPLVPLLAPSPLAPFVNNNSTPKLSGMIYIICTINSKIRKSAQQN